MRILLRLEVNFDFKDLTSCCLPVPFYFPTLCSFFFPPLSDLSSSAGSPWPFLVFLSLGCLQQNYLTLSLYRWNQNFWSQGPKVCIFTSSPADSFVPEEIKSHRPKNWPPQQLPLPSPSHLPLHPGSAPNLSCCISSLPCISPSSLSPLAIQGWCKLTV